MTKETLAALLNGREIGSEITRGEAEAAKAAGLVVVFGASDDLMEFAGAIYDEIGCYEGGTARIDRGGVLDRCIARDGYGAGVIAYDRDDAVDELAARKKTARKIEALWCAEEGGPAWSYRTDIPHSTFEIYEDGEVWCRGIVFSLDDLAATVGA